MKKIILSFILVFAITEPFAMAKNLSSQPDWKHPTEYKVNLSGVGLNFETPTKTSGDFPVIEATNKNLYEDSQYGKWSAFTLSQMYWDYEYRKFFFKERWGTLHMLIHVQKRPDSVENLSSPKQLQAAITQVVESNYAKVDMEVSPRDFQNMTSDDTDWIKYKVPASPANGATTHYAVRLTDDHYMNVRFELMNSENDPDFREVAETDIRRIIDSFSISYPASN